MEGGNVPHVIEAQTWVGFGQDRQTFSESVSSYHRDSIECYFEVQAVHLDGGTA